jgi:DNA-binding LacI/PurR family transcriptional regulator
LSKLPQAFPKRFDLSFMKVTLKDIAEATDFSISTISRALRGEGRISTEHKQKIIETAYKMGYKVPSTKKSATKIKIRHIAIITQFHTGEFYASFFDGFDKAARDLDIVVSLFNVSGKLDSIDTLINNLKSLGYSAAVIFVPGLTEKMYQGILPATPSDFPIISCSNIYRPVLDTVTFDAYRGASLVAAHFLDQGFKSFGLIEGPLDKPEARFRTNGFEDYIDTIDDASLIWTYKGNYTIDAGRAAFEDFKKLENKPRAVFAANDAMAFGFMEAARKNGWVFPDSIALAGYDNLPQCQNHYPGLTSVNTDFEVLARNTFEKLLSRLEKPQEHQGIVTLVPVSLETRQSSIAKTGN